MLQIKPLVNPTKAIMSVQITNFQWHEFFPRGINPEDLLCTCNILLIRKKGSYFLLVCFAAKNNIGVVIALWAPIILVWLVLVSLTYSSLSFLIQLDVV